MKKITILLLFLCSSCNTTVTSPIFKSELTGEISAEGIGLTVKPPVWQWCCDAYNYIVEDQAIEVDTPEK